MELEDEQIHILNAKGCGACPCGFYDLSVPVTQCYANNKRSIIHWGSSPIWFPDWCPLIKNILEYISELEQLKITKLQEKSK